MSRVSINQPLTRSGQTEAQKWSSENSRGTKTGKRGGTETTARRLAQAEPKITRVNDPELKFEEIKPENFKKEIEAKDFLEPKEKKDLIAICNQMGFDKTNKEAGEFCRVYVNKEGEVELHANGKHVAAHKGRHGAWFAMTGWISDLFAGHKQGALVKAAKAGSGFLVADPSNKKAKLEPVKNLIAELESNRASVVLEYNLRGEKPKEPVAFLIYNQLHQGFEQMRESIKDAPDGVKEQLGPVIDGYENGPLDKFIVCRQGFVRQDCAEQFIGDETGAMGNRQRLLARAAMTTRASVVYPGPVFLKDMAEAPDGTLFEKIPGLYTIELVDGKLQEVACKDACVARPEEEMKVEIPPQTFADAFAMVGVSETFASPKDLDMEALTLLEKVRQRNIAAIEKFNMKINPKSELTEEQVSISDEEDIDPAQKA